MDTIQHWRGRNHPRLENIEACLNAIGYRLVVVPCRDDEGRELCVKMEPKDITGTHTTPRTPRHYDQC